MTLEMGLRVDPPRRGQPQGIENRRRHEVGVPDRRQRHKQRPIGEFGLEFAGELQREPGLPGPTRSGEGEQTVFGECFRGRGYFLLPTDEIRERHRDPRLRLGYTQFRELTW